MFQKQNKVEDLYIPIVHNLQLMVLGSQIIRFRAIGMHERRCGKYRSWLGGSQSAANRLVIKKENEKKKTAKKKSTTKKTTKKKSTTKKKA